MPINMSYCRARNTLEALKELYDGDIDLLAMDRDEFRAMVRLVKICKDFAEEWEHLRDPNKVNRLEARRNG